MTEEPTDPIDDLRDAINRIYYLERELEAAYRISREKDAEIDRLKKQLAKQASRRKT
jgi:hypothetical protein